MSGALYYLDKAISPQTGETRVVFRENTGLANVFSLDLILETFNCEAIEQYVKRREAMNSKKEKK